MLDSSIAELRRAASDARHQVHALDLEAKLFDAEGAGQISDARMRELTQHLQGKTLIKRRFVYCGLVIVVSGMLEQYLDAVIAEYVQGISSIVDHPSELPSAVTSNHLNLSLDYLAAVARDSYRGVDSVEEIISRLYNSHCNRDSFEPNDRAFAYRKANYRCELVNQIFARVGVSNILQRVYDSTAFGKFVKSQLELDDSQNLDRTSVFKRLDDLAERRNDVAHGNVTQILSHELLVPYIDFVEALADSIREVLLEELFSVLANRPPVFHKPFQVINGSIVCIVQVNQKVRIGDIMVFAVPSAKRFLGGEIVKMQVNNGDVDSVDGTSVPVDVGFELNARVKENYWIGIVSQERIYRNPSR